MYTDPVNVVVTAQGAIATAQGLGSCTASLAAWYGEPVAAADAARLHAETGTALRARYCAGLPAFALQVQQLIGHFWLGISISLEYEQLAASTSEQRDRALLEIVYGQLLLSRKLWPAMQHLDRGFKLAARYLGVTDYFLLVRRHDLLRHIPLSNTRVIPHGLQSLLAEAAVIRQLQGTGRPHSSVSHRDTIG